MKLTIIVPSIRIYNWKSYINSIEKSCSEYSYEIIFIGPEYNSIIDEYKNIKYIRDFGHPNRCQQIGILLSEGEYITFSADDCLYKENSINKCLNILSTNNIDYLTTGYMEGGNVAVHDFSIRHCYASGKHINPNWKIFNSVFIKRKIVEKYNLDTTFAVTCIGHVDLACRIQYDDTIKGLVLNENIMECSHLPDRTGDHGPIADSQTFIDGPSFFKKYNRDVFPENLISWNNWKSDTQNIWSDRFI